MANFSLDISGAISTGWEYAKKHGILIAVIYLVSSLISGGLQNVYSTHLYPIDPNIFHELGQRIAQGDAEALQQAAETYGYIEIGALIGAIIGLIINVGLYNLTLGIASGRFTEVCLKAFQLPFTVYLKVVAVQIITSILIFISALFCIIPAFYVGSRLTFATIYMVDHPDADILEAIKASWKMTEGNVLALIGISLLLIGIGLIGLLCCCVGYYFALAISLFAMTAAYYQLKGNLV